MLETDDVTGESDRITLADFEEGNAYYYPSTEELEGTEGEILRVQARLKELGITMVPPDTKIKKKTGEKKPSKASQHWRDTFEAVKQASLLELQAGAEECLWYVIYTNKDEAGAAYFTRTSIIKSKDNFMVPGVWRLRARSLTKNDTFDRCVIQAQFVCENEKSPTEVTILQTKRKTL